MLPQCDDLATLLFTQHALDEQVQYIWDKIKALRSEDLLPDPIRITELVRLFTVLEDLEVETTRINEKYRNEFISSLRIKDIGGVVLTDGSNIHVSQQIRPKPRIRAVSYGFVDQGNPESSGRHPSGIILNRKAEIRKRLSMLANKKPLSSDEANEQSHLLEELHQYDDA